MPIQLKNFLYSHAERRLHYVGFLLLTGSISLGLVSIAISQILLAGAAITGILQWRRREEHLFWPPILWPLLFLVIWTLVSAVTSPDIAMGLQKAKKFFLFLPLFLVPLIIQNVGQTIRIYHAIFFVSGIASAAGLVQFIQDPDRDPLHRISGFMSHWMTFSGLLMLVLVLLAGYALCFGWKKHWWIAPLAIALSTSLYLSQTRSALLGAILGAITVLLLLKRYRYLLLVFVALLVLFLSSPDNIRQRLTSAWNLQDPNTRNRIELFETSVRLIKDNPWCGVGLGSVGREALRYRGSSDFPDWMYQHMHNNFLQITAERGIPGLIIWLWFMIRLAWDALRCFHKAGYAEGHHERSEARVASTAALGSWVALLAAGMFEYNFGDSEILLLFLFIMSAPYAYLSGKISLSPNGKMIASPSKEGGYRSEPAARTVSAIAPWIIFSTFLRKIYLQRGLIRNFVVRDLRSRYIGSFMGFFWSVIHPIVLLVSYTFVFKFVFGIRPRPDTGTTSFALFLFCGILPWLFFQDTLQRSSTVVIDNANLVTKTIFPSEILPLTVLLAGVVNHIIGFAILLGVIFYTLGKVSVFILLVPAYFAVLAMLTLGISWLVASLNVFVRDVSQVLNVILTFWFWFTPIFYTPDQFPDQFAFLMHLNPLAHVVTGYKDCLLRMKMPDLTVLAVLAVSALAVFIAGGTFFRLTKREFVDVL